MGVASAMLLLLLSAVFIGVCHGDVSDAELNQAAEKYNPKSCKYHPIPSTFDSIGYLQYNGEVYLGDVFGIPDDVHEHTLAFKVKKRSIITASVEVHRDSLAEVKVDLYKGSENHVSGEYAKPVLWGTQMPGAGGDNAKCYLTGDIDNKGEDYRLVFKITADLAQDEPGADARWRKSSCFPVRVDITVVAIWRMPYHIPSSCPGTSGLPVKREKITLDDKGFHDSNPPSKPYVYVFTHDRVWNPFKREVWSLVVDVPPRLHRFVRFFLRSTFRFISGPFQILIELFDLNTTPDETATEPSCQMGCIGATPIYNGQVMDHAMPSGFTYKLWLLAGEPMYLSDSKTHCMEFDLEVDIKYESKLTPFEVGPQSWMCTNARLPAKIVQSDSHNTDDLEVGTIEGRALHIRDWFGFPPDELEEMKHVVTLDVREPSLFRVTTHKSSVDLRIILTTLDAPPRVIAPPVRMHALGGTNDQTIHTPLPPGKYGLGFFADYPLGGLHPCDGFFVQVALKPVELVKQSGSCVDSGQVYLGEMLRSKRENWQRFEKPIPSTTAQPHILASKSFNIGPHDPATYLKMGIKSDYLTSDFRLQLNREGMHVSEPRVTSNGYAELLGPLEPGSYTVDIYYVGRPKLDPSKGGSGNKFLDASETRWADNLVTCATFWVDMRLIERTGEELRGEDWLCRAGTSELPALISTRRGEELVIDSQFIVPPSGRHLTLLDIAAPSIIKITTVGLKSTVRMRLATNPSGVRSPADGGGGGMELLQPGQVVQESTNSLFARLDQGGSYQLHMVLSQATDFSTVCPVVQLHMVVEPLDLIPACPWAAGSFSALMDSTRAQQAAADHLGSVLLNLVPRKVSHKLEVSKPTQFWMSPDMKTSFPFTVADQPVAVRVEVELHPPWLPLAIELVPKPSQYTSTKPNQPRSVGKLMESRILLMDEEVDRGEYELVLRMTEDRDAISAMATLCAHATINAEIGEQDELLVNQLRAELLDLPDLLAIQPLPPSLNMVGYLSLPDAPVLSTNIFTFDKVKTTELQIQKPTLIRFVCEPADLSNAHIHVRVMDGGSQIAESDSLGHMVAVLQPGYYRIDVQATEAFLVTLGMSALDRLEADAHSASKEGCSATVPTLPVPGSGSGALVGQQQTEWSTGYTNIRLDHNFAQNKGQLMEVPVQAKVPSLLYIELGSPFLLQFVRIGVHVPEGLWVGEQRAMINALRIEVPPGTYHVQISQPEPPPVKFPFCVAFSSLISLTPLSRDSPGTSRECVSYGAMPLPLDLSGGDGGAAVLGGPVDSNGRLLIRSRVVITDMHDGRKKLYLDTKGRTLVLKIGVTIGTSDELNSLNLHVVGPDHKPIQPDFDWNVPGAWERIFTLSEKSVWLIFHHEHREAMEKSCSIFDLAIAAFPKTDMDNMLSCSNNGLGRSEDFHALFDQQRVAAAALSGRGAENGYDSGVRNVAQEAGGFLETLPFTLGEDSVVIASIGYNFFLSHVEMDIIGGDADPRKAKSIMFSEIDFVNGASSPVNARQWVALYLPKGKYQARIADDHFPGQFRAGSGRQCFPLQFSFSTYPVIRKGAPSYGVSSAASAKVVSVHPQPSMPLMYGQDLMLSIRFSSPAKASPAEAQRLIALQGQSGQRVAPSDYLRLEEEGGYLWNFVWIGEVLQALAPTVTLTLSDGFVSEGTGRPYVIEEPITYRIATTPDFPDKLPWTGGPPVPSAWSASMLGDGWHTQQGARPPGGAPGSVSSESSSGRGTTTGDRGPGRPGEVYMEQPGAAGGGWGKQDEPRRPPAFPPAAPPPPPPPPVIVHEPVGGQDRLPGLGEAGGVSIKAEQEIHCGEGFVINPVTGMCDPIPADSRMRTGMGAWGVLGWSFVLSVVAILLLIAWRAAEIKMTTRHAYRYTPVTTEENFGLVDRDDDDDDDTAASSAFRLSSR
ncbi:unnamed protein product [Vitrella brassicaformis CCMP3155]|uniref:C2 domain-containing protein n=4 Tax=Vitrella brassicaformis TaxID=1169539 RepID=A0A0G4FF68_VITBC|nr:unnamed protein product [Vitrella brassicaformis CCMP3155]|eukprot:CEM11840.1 unnamed protein product [Vitrella brassicaformis CCMP3155]